MSIALTKNGTAPDHTPGKHTPGNRTPANRPSRPRTAPTPAIASASAAAARPDYLAHDARNWLTVLQVYCDLLRTPGSASADRGRWLDELSRAVERGHGLVASLIDTVHDTAHAPTAATPPIPDSIPDPIPGPTHLSGASLPLAPLETSPIETPPLDLRDALERRLPLLRHLAGDRVQVAMEVATEVPIDVATEVPIQVPPAPLPVRIPEMALERILFNLVRNALEAMPLGGQLTLGLRAELRETPGGAHRKIIRLQIADTGDGIPPERLAHIFEAGYSLRAPGDPMRGLGLAIVQELTERYGGTVAVQSRPGHGTRFVLEFPAG